MGMLRLGIVGLGGMGTHHLKYMGSVRDVVVTALCDPNPQRLEAAGEIATRAERYDDWLKLLNSGLVDAVLVATPHYQHPEIAIAALKRDIHVLTEKPVAVSVGAARKVNEVAATKPQVKYAAMFQQRTWPGPRGLRELVDSGELGEISRLTWIVTDWFRPDSYYASGTWRATWAGEGGGVLLNQCPHNLDLVGWISGLAARRVTAVAHIGKTHPIETEDEVSAIIEFDGGATGHFVTTTGEAPGTNFLEIAGDRGVARLEGGRLTFRRTRQSVREFRRTSPGAFSTPEIDPIELPVPPTPELSHRIITQNFVDAVVRGEPLIAPGEEGVRSLELGNAMLQSGLSRCPVDLPLDAEAFEKLLRDLQTQYQGRKSPAATVALPSELRF